MVLVVSIEDDIIFYTNNRKQDTNTPKQGDTQVHPVLGTAKNGPRRDRWARQHHRKRQHFLHSQVFVKF